MGLRRLLIPAAILCFGGLILTGCPQGAALENAEDYLVQQNCDALPLFEVNCQSSDCHGAGENGMPPGGGVDILSPGYAARLLDQPATYPELSDCPSPPELYINSQNWQASLLWTKLNDTQACGDPMPVPHAVLGFDEAQLACVADWIQGIIAAGGDPSGSGGAGNGTGGDAGMSGGATGSGGMDGSGGMGASAGPITVEAECALLPASCSGGVTGSVMGDNGSGTPPGTEDGNGGTAVNYLGTGVSLTYAGVMTSGHDTMTVVHSKGDTSGGSVSVQLGDGTVLGSFNAIETGDWMTYQTATVTLSQPLTGAQTIVLVVQDSATALNIDSFELTVGGAAP